MSYLYIYLDPRKPGKYSYDNCATFFFEPIYVGKGTGKRAFSHINEVNWSKTKSSNNIKLNKLNKILQTGELPIILILYESTEEEILVLEELYINSIGLLSDNTGPLTNIRKTSWASQPNVSKNRRIGNGCEGKRYTTISNGMLTFRVDTDKVQSYIDKGFSVVRWQKPLKNNSKSRIGDSNPMKGKSAVKGRKWILTESGENLFLTPQEISELKVNFKYGRKVDKNARKRVILEGQLMAKYMSVDEVNNLPKGTRYQYGLIWVPGKQTFIVE